jgi:hypothetical protein
MCVKCHVTGDTLRVFDGWTDSFTSQLAYFVNYDGDRSAGFDSLNGDADATSVTGGPSARLLQSTVRHLTRNFPSPIDLPDQLKHMYTKDDGNLLAKCHRAQ